MRRREFLASLTASAFAAAPKPNFVFVLCDDLGWRDFGCYGNKSHRTPNIDRLATEGMRFTDAYAACPVCSPTRASILTGKYPARLGLTDFIPGRKQWPTARLLVPPVMPQLPLAEVTLAEALKPAGYASASIGKWHLGGEGFSPLQQGFDLNVAGTASGSPRSYFGPFDLPNLDPGGKSDYLTDRLTDEAVKFMEANRDRPFFLYLPHFAVHIPLGAKQEIAAKYPNDPNPIYAAMVESVDDSVGLLMRKLEDLGLAERTVFILTSDNGGLRYEGKRPEPVTDNSPLRAGKGHVFEGGIREPLIVRWPGRIPKGVVNHDPVSSVDYFPTVLSLAGIPAPRVDGIDLSPALLQRKKLPERPLFWHYPHYSNQGGTPSSAMRLGDYKLIEFLEDGRIELFNLAKDPGERVNLARREAGRAAKMHVRLEAWRRSVNAAMPTQNPAYDAAQADQGLKGAEPPTPAI